MQRSSRKNRERESRRGLWWLAAFGWAALIFWLSSSPDAQGGADVLGLLPFGDKLAHALAFGVLATFAYLASGRFWLALGLAAAYGLTDELHQAFVPGRSPDVRDWLADALGALLALSAVRYLTQARRGASGPVQ